MVDEGGAVVEAEAAVAFIDEAGVVDEAEAVFGFVDEAGAVVGFLADTVTVRVDTIVTGTAVMVLDTTIVDLGAEAVMVFLNVVVEGVIDRQEQAEEIADEAKAVR